jgi:L-malate glycosyltransferase
MPQNMPKILHIAAHYGGGIGSVVNNLPGDKVSLNRDSRNKESLFNVDMIKDYDVILVHVWNHPSLFDFLVNTDLPACRLIGWAHMSGLHVPYVLFKKLIKYFDDFYYTSPISNQCGIVCDTIWSSRNLSDFINIKRNKSKKVTIGYIGTVDYSKMHPDFIKICDSFDCNVLVVGEGCDLDKVKQKANGRYKFTGLVKNIKPYLEQMDIFVYPLNPKHFGTCEQVLGEAMATGLPCYVLDNPAEQYIMSQCAVKKGDFWHPIREKVLDLYSSDKMRNKWQNVFDKQDIKKERSWKGHNAFLESLGDYARVFNDYIKAEEAVKEMLKSNQQWSSQSKGSIKQYLDYFPNDHYLKQWNKLL